MTQLTFYGHSCFSVEISGKTLLFDPFITPNPLAKGIDIDSIQADYILISHGHEDHVADALPILQRTGAMLISNFEIVTWFGQQGIENAHPLNHGGSVTLPFGTVKYVTAIHSSVLPDGTYGGNPGGFVIESASAHDDNFYFSGDTALTYDMKLLSEFHNLDWAVLCVGDNFTMGHADAAICAEWIGVNEVVGTHFDSFPYIEIDHTAAKQSFSKKGITLHLPTIGDTITLGNLSDTPPANQSPNQPSLHTGLGYDVHQFAENRPLILGGVHIPHTHGLAGHSDADVLCHAIADALLGAMGLADIGYYFPPEDDSIEGISSLKILEKCRDLLAERQGTIHNIDSSMIAECPKVLPHAEAMKTNIANALGISPAQIGIKATTNESMGFVGRKEGIAALASALVECHIPHS
jgi:2-C-methyl-D-erythritol 2,4-cyclodiphosphate synthase